MHRPATLFACRAWVKRATRQRCLGLPVEHILLQSRLRLKINTCDCAPRVLYAARPSFSSRMRIFIVGLVKCAPVSCHASVLRALNPGAHAVGG